MTCRCKSKALIQLIICFLTAFWMLCAGSGTTTAAPTDSAAGLTAADEQTGGMATGQMTLAQAREKKWTGLLHCADGLYYLENGEICRNIWKNADGKKYYFTASGTAERGKSVRIDKKYYVFDSGGALSEGKAVHALKMEDGTLYLVKKNGQASPKGWQKCKKKKAWVYKNGRMAVGIVKAEKSYWYFNAKGWLGKFQKDRIVTVKGKDYFVQKSGECGRGWCSIGKEYCFCKQNGLLLKNTKKNGIRIDNNGIAKTRPLTPLEKRTLSIVNSITRENMSKGQKIAACWNYITSQARFSYLAPYDPGAYTRAEFQRLALLILNLNGGNCYGFAAGFAALTKAAGCQSYVVYGLCPGTRDRRPDGLTRHSWVYIPGFGYFDPEGQFAGFAHIYAAGSCPWIEHGRIAI